MFNFDNTLGYEPPLDVHNLTDEQTAISIENLNLFYGQAQGIARYFDEYPKRASDSIYRPVWLW